MIKIADREVPTEEVVILATGVVLFVFSFAQWFGGKLCYSGFGVSHACTSVSEGVSSWHVGILAWGAVVLGVLAAVAVALRRFGAQSLRLPVGEASLVLGLSSLATLLVLIKLAIGETYHGFGVTVSLGRSYGLYLSVIALLVQTVVAAALFRRSGEALPWRSRPSRPSATTL